MTYNDSDYIKIVRKNKKNIKHVFIETLKT